MGKYISIIYPNPQFVLPLIQKCKHAVTQLNQIYPKGQQTRRVTLEQ